MGQQCAVDLVNPSVDCAYTLEEQVDLSLDPNVVVRSRLVQAGYDPPCEPCLQALHRFWCGQTAPTCGTFDKILDEILPELRQITTGQEKPDALIEAALPRMIAAFSLGLPCKEMCLEVTSFCSCGQITTFGQAMEFLEAARPGREPAVGSVQGSAREVGRQVEERCPLDLRRGCRIGRLRRSSSMSGIGMSATFSPDMPGFEGKCYKHTQVVASCDWCKDGAETPDEMAVEIVAQMHSLYRAGLEQVLFAAAFPLASVSHHVSRTRAAAAAAAATGRSTGAGGDSAAAAAASAAGTGAGAGAGGREGGTEQEGHGGEEGATEARAEVEEVETEEAVIEAEEKKEFDFGGIEEEDSAVSWDPREQVLGAAGAADVMGGMETGGRADVGRASGSGGGGGGMEGALHGVATGRGEGGLGRGKGGMTAGG
ncbi:hypothetical protein CLOM_g11741 [Closterium sp. NIES-68]|nr:hypothetical protein CLOM_g11741 [Closterium sp. NIES-68]